MNLKKYEDYNKKAILIAFLCTLLLAYFVGRSWYVKIGPVLNTTEKSEQVN